MSWPWGKLCYVWGLGRTGREKTQDLAAVQSGFSIQNILTVDAYITNCTACGNPLSLPFSCILTTFHKVVYFLGGCTHTKTITFTYCIMSSSSRLDKIPAFADYVIIGATNKRITSSVAFVWWAFNFQKQWNHNSHVQFSMLDSGAAWSAVCPTWIRLLLLIACVCMCVCVRVFVHFTWQRGRSKENP